MQSMGLKQHIENTLEAFEKYNPQVDIRYDKDRYRDLIKNAKSIPQLNKEITMLNILWGVSLTKIKL
jgi:hypothetical protein